VTHPGLLDQLQTLPLHQTTALRVLELLDDPDVGVSRLAELVATDPSLAARLLKLANSAFFARRSAIDTVDRAVMVVGLQTVRTFTLAAAFDLFDDQKGPLPAGFWAHGVATASVASALAKQVGIPSSTAMCAGLLHDVGQALLVRLVPSAARSLDRVVDEEGRLALERELIGIDHQAAAAAALTAARFPRPLVDAIGAHHIAIDAHTASRRGKVELAQVLSIADTIAHRVTGDVTVLDGVVTPGDGVARWEVGIVAEVLEAAGLPQVDAGRIVADCHDTGTTALVAA
jgi:putative nucleotidyltransferase with HDIG domain